MQAVFLAVVLVGCATLAYSLPIGNRGSESTESSFGCEPGENICSKCYGVLENELFINDRNRYNLQRAFFPPDTTNPVFVGVTYYFTRNESGNGSTDYSLTSPNQSWFWTESTFYLFQPIQSLQFTSLLFADSTFRESTVSLYLQPDCEMADLDMMKLLTQRVRHTMCKCCMATYHQSHVTFPPAVKSVCHGAGDTSRDLRYLQCKRGESADIGAISYRSECCC